MNKKLCCISLLLFFFSHQSWSQTYISFAPALTNTAGTVADKSNMAIEAGRQWDVFSMGLAFGKTTLSRVGGRDTSNYLEIRPNLNIFQQGKFTNTFTAGIGYIFQARENLLTELTSGIEYSLTESLHFNVDFGQYFYSGKVSASTVTFFGISAVYFFKPDKSGSLIKQKN
jgi:hypothetical protein